MQNQPNTKLYSNFRRPPTGTSGVRGLVGNFPLQIPSTGTPDTKLRHDLAALIGLLAWYICMYFGLLIACAAMGEVA